jgi:hypothetical protein
MAKTKAKKRQVDEDDLEDLEDLEDEEVEDDEEEAPRSKSKKKGSSKKTKAKPKKKEVIFGTAALLELIEEETDKKLTGRNLRVLLRKMSKNGKLNRTVGEDKTNYSWSGPEDPEVKRIVKAIRDGEFERVKKEKLDELKGRKAAKKTAKKAAKKSARASDDDDDEDEDDE